MSQMFKLVLQQSLLGLLLFGLVFALDQLIKKKSFSPWRSFVWTLYFVFLLIPVQWIVTNFLPKNNLPPVLLEVSVGGLLLPTPLYGTSKTYFSWIEGGTYLWLVGFIVSFVLFIILPFLQERQMRRGLYNKSQALSLGDQATGSLHIVDAEILPFVSGLIRSRIYIPKKLVQHLSQEQLQSILLHEKAHVLNKDLLKILVARFSICIFWFSPFVYLAYYKMREAQECVADQYALSHNHKINQGEYARTLLKISMLGELETWGAFGVSILNKSHLRKRIEAVSNFNPSMKRKVLFPITLVALVMGVSLTLFCLGAIDQNTNDIVTVMMEVKSGDKIIAQPRMVTRLEQEVMVFVKQEGGDSWAIRATPKKSGELILLSGLMCESPQNKKEWESLDVQNFENINCEKKFKFEVATELGQSVMMKQKDHYIYRFKIIKGASLKATIDTMEDSINVLKPMEKEESAFKPTKGYKKAKGPSESLIEEYFGFNNPKKC